MKFSEEAPDHINTPVDQDGMEGMDVQELDVMGRREFLLRKIQAMLNNTKVYFAVVLSILLLHRFESNCIMHNIKKIITLLNRTTHFLK